MNLRELFFRHIAQTSPSPLAFEVEKAEGVWLYGSKGEKLLDLISGIAVSNVGHRHPRVVEAIREQSERYFHTLVYGEMIQSPQVRLAEKISSVLPPSLNSVYFLNSGSEAIEGALKLAKRATGRSRIFSMKHAYHGSSHGALSVTGDAALKQGYGPMLPDVYHIPYNDFSALQQIDYHTAAVIVEGIQGEAGVIVPQAGYLTALRQRCSQVGALMILDEIQTGFGRTSTLFYLEQAGIVPDILTIAKGMGAGLPIGAFVASRELMSVLSFNPVLGHISTFGGHPLSAAAALAGLEVLTESGFMEEVREKSLYLRQKLGTLPGVLEIRGTGMMYALLLKDAESVQRCITRCLEKGVLTDWFLFAPDCVRIAPPLVISREEIDFAIQGLEYGLGWERFA